MKKLFAALLFFVGAAHATTTVPSSLISWVTAPSAPSQTAKYVFAAPNGSAGAPTFRALLPSDIAGVGVTTSPLSQFAATTSAQLASVLSDETGSGAAVFATGAAINPASTGATTPGTGAFTTLSASGTVSGAGFTSLLSPYLTSSTAASTYAPLSSPAMTGVPTVPTATTGTNTTQIASTAFVSTAVSNGPATGWTTYSPTITAQSGAFTTASATGAYYAVGGLVCVRVTGTITTVGSATGSVTITLPKVANNGTGAGSVVIAGRANAVSGKMLSGLIGQNTSNLILTNYDNTSPIAAGESLLASGCYVSS